MNAKILSRLSMDIVAAGLFLIGLAYWWLGNAIHEFVGTAMFVLVIAHNIINRRWYRTLPKTRKEPRSLLNVVLTFVLALVMLVLLGTSIIISKTLSFGFYDGFTVRQIHVLAGYWGLVIVAIHLGFRWQMIMGIVRNLFGVSKPGREVTFAMRLMAAGVALYGAMVSSSALDMGYRLSMTMTLDWWNFEESVIGFFVHTIAIMGFYIFATHYALVLFQTSKRNNRSARPIPQNINK
ncbi:MULTISPECIES: DUF4405 domain-containing protein [Alphaproteobacteria]|uniref:DUF4405 domain-containing protein n=1 Tax=Alphaproteobacteria TaxID=28211 RepID=UPI003A9055E5